MADIDMADAAPAAANVAAVANVTPAAAGGGQMNHQVKDVHQIRDKCVKWAATFVDAPLAQFRKSLDRPSDWPTISPLNNFAKMLIFSRKSGVINATDYMQVLFLYVVSAVGIASFYNRGVAAWLGAYLGPSRPLFSAHPAVEDEKKSDTTTLPNAHQPQPKSKLPPISIPCSLKHTRRDSLYGIVPLNKRLELIAMTDKYDDRALGACVEWAAKWNRAHPTESKVWTMHFLVEVVRVSTKMSDDAAAVVASGGAERITKNGQQQLIRGCPEWVLFNVADAVHLNGRNAVELFMLIDAMVEVMGADWTIRRLHMLAQILLDFGYEQCTYIRRTVFSALLRVHLIKNGAVANDLSYHFSHEFAESLCCKQHMFAQTLCTQLPE